MNRIRKALYIALTILVVGITFGMSRVTAYAGEISIISQPTDVTVIPGGKAIFSVGVSGNVLAYQWEYSANGGATWNNSGSPGNKTASQSFSAPIAYNGYKIRCKITNSSGYNVYTKVVTLTVTDAIKITSQPADLTVAAGGRAVFSVGATGNGLMYQWEYSTNGGATWNNSGSLGNKTSSQSFSAPLAYNGYRIRCKITNNSGLSVYTNPAKLSVEGIKINSQPSDVTVTPGGRAIFSVGATGIGLSYQWEYSTNGGVTWNNSGSTGNKTASQSFSAPIAYNGYKIRCKISDNGGSSVYTKDVMLTVTDAIKIISQPADVCVTAGGTVVFNVNATGTGLTYQWEYSTNGGVTWNNSGSTGNKTASQRFSAPIEYDGYKIRCRITNAYGLSIYSNIANLTVDGIRITIQPEDVIVKPGEKAVFSVSATGNGLSYQWEYSTNGGVTWNNSGSTGNKTASQYFNAPIAYNGYKIRCKIANVNGLSVYTKVVTLNVVDGIKIINQPTNVTVSAGGRAEFSVNATGTGLTYQWEYSTNGGATWNNSGSAGNKTASQSFNAPIEYNGYKIRCKIMNSTGMITYTNIVTLTVEGIKIINQPVDVTVEDGEIAVFSVNAIGNGLTYQWEYSTNGGATWNNSGSVGNKTASQRFSAPIAYNGYRIRCKITNSNGLCLYTNTVLLNVKGKKNPSLAWASYGNGDRTYTFNQSGAGTYTIRATAYGEGFETTYVERTIYVVEASENETEIIGNDNIILSGRTKTFYVTVENDVKVTWSVTKVSEGSGTVNVSSEDIIITDTVEIDTEVTYIDEEETIEVQSVEDDTMGDEETVEVEISSEYENSEEEFESLEDNSVITDEVA